LKTARLQKISLKWIIVLAGMMIFPLGLSAETTAEHDIRTILSQYITCRSITVKAEAVPGNPNQFTSLSIKIDTVDMNHLIADHVTIQYQSPYLNLAEMKKSKIFNINRYQDFKIGILVSTGSIKQYMDYKAKQYGKEYRKLNIKLSPPYLEFEFSIAADQLSQDVHQVLSKFIIQDQLEGYSALNLSVADNRLTAQSPKSIVNHFKLPETVLKELGERFNPLLDIPVLLPFRYQLNKISIQKNYLYLSL